MTALLSTPNSFASSYTRTFATTLPASARHSGPLSRPGAANAPDRRQLLLFIATCSSSAHCNLNPSLRPCAPFVPVPAARGSTWPCWVMADRPRSGPRQIAGKPVIGERSGDAKRSRKRPAAPSLLQAVQVGVQVCPPTRAARRGINDDPAVDRHHAEQVRLGSANLAPHAGTDHRPGHDERQERTAWLTAYSAGASAAPGTLSDIGVP